VVKDLPNKEGYFSNKITLIRKQDIVEVSTCKSYLRKVYGNLGSDFLKNIITALQNNAGIYGK
jgi:RNA binding exosome subunit